MTDRDMTLLRECMFSVPTSDRELIKFAQHSTLLEATLSRRRRRTVACGAFEKTEDADLFTLFLEYTDVLKPEQVYVSVEGGALIEQPCWARQLIAALRTLATTSHLRSFALSSNGNANLPHVSFTVLMWMVVQNIAAYTNLFDVLISQRKQDVSLLTDLAITTPRMTPYATEELEISTLGALLCSGACSIKYEDAHAALLNVRSAGAAQLLLDPPTANVLDLDIYTLSLSMTSAIARRKYDVACFLVKRGALVFYERWELLLRPIKRYNRRHFITEYRRLNKSTDFPNYEKLRVCSNVLSFGISFAEIDAHAFADLWTNISTTWDVYNLDRIADDCILTARTKGRVDILEFLCNEHNRRPPLLDDDAYHTTDFHGCKETSAKRNKGGGGCCRMM